MKLRNTGAGTARPPAAVAPRGQAPDTSVSTQGGEGLVRGQALQTFVDGAPRMREQRQAIDAAFGAAAGRARSHVVTKPRGAATEKAASPSQSPVQRKVGLEFQAYAKLFNLRNEHPPYGHKVFDLPGQFHVESDEGDVEFVSEPFEEDKAGLVGLTTAVGGMVTMARSMEKMRTDTSDVDEPQAPRLVDVARAFGAGTYQSTYPDEDSELYIGDPQSPDEGPNLNAAPQATVGVRLDEIPTLFEVLAGEGALAHRLHGMETFAKAGQQSRAQTVLANDLKVIDGERNLNGESGALRGFVTLVLVYLRNAASSKDAHKEYVKIAHPVMARNSFTAMFDLLDEQDQLRFLNAYGPEQLLKLSGLGSKLSDKLYPNDYKGEDEKLHTSPTVGAWLVSIARDDKLAKLPGNIVGRGMGGSKHMDEVAKAPTGGATPAMAPVFELRRMLQNVKPDDWVSLARLVHGLMNALNGQTQATLSQGDEDTINTEVNGYKRQDNAQQAELNSDQTELKYHR